MSLLAMALACGFSAAGCPFHFIEIRLMSLIFWMKTNEKYGTLCEASMSSELWIK